MTVARLWRLVAGTIAVVAAVALSSVHTTAPTLAAAVRTASDLTATTCPADADQGTPDRVWQVAATRLAELSGPSTFPFGATGPGPYLRTSAYAWTSGFFPASLWVMYAHTQDSTWLQRARSYTDRVLPVARWTGTHDLGFMVGLPAGLGQRLDPSKERRARYGRAIVTAASSLSTRWNARIGAIRSGEYSGQWGLIIDSAMNAPMLIEAGQMTDGAPGVILMKRGLRHLLTLADTLVRPDGSTFHRMTFDPRTGRLIGPVAGQGLSTTSTWARGQAWAVNGFTRGYALTQDPRLLDVARRVADYWLAHVPGGCVPAWDLDVTSGTAPLDSSAAAIAADGLQSLALLEPDADRAARYGAAARATWGALSAQAFVPSATGSRGILQRQAYDIPSTPREGTYSWGDAYLLSGLQSSLGRQSSSSG